MKNQTRIVILVLLLLGNILFLIFAETSSGVSFDEDLFVVADTSEISSVTMASGQNRIVLERSQKGWQVNQKYPADENLVRVLLSILKRVRVKKPVDVTQEEAVGVGITGGKPMSLSVWGNPTKTRTFFSLTGSGEAYEVVIPGYKEYVGGIFELNPDQWRDRLVLNESWRTIQNLTLNYLQSEESDFSIQFDQDFFRVDKVDQIDSSAVVDYLNQFQYFEANEWISKGRFSKYDSLATTPPLAILQIESINSEFPILLDIYPQLGNDPFHLVVGQDDAMMAVDKRRIKGILLKPNDFQSKDSIK